MKIDPDICTSCTACIQYCPVGCIHEDEGTVYINQEECVECSVCFNADVCPVDAIFMPTESYEYPRAIRMQFSDPGVQHPNLKSWGRGTEEAKTNDVTGKFPFGTYGLLLEFGRPGTGTRFTEVEKITTVICPMGVKIEEDNPVYTLLEDPSTGKIKREFINEKVLSVILELILNEDQLPEILSLLRPLFDTLDTVVSLGLVSRFSEDGNIPVIGLLEKSGFPVRPNAKINVGLGRPLIS